MKYISKVLAIILVLSLMPVYALAAGGPTGDANFIYLEDGSYLVVEISGIDTRASTTKSGNKSFTYHSSDGTEKWKATLIGSFTYNGTTSTCNSCYLRLDIYDTNWYEVSRDYRVSGNTAYGDLTMARKILGITYKEETYNFTLTCDKNGNLS